MTITDTCQICNKVEVFEYDLTTKKILPCDETERKIYRTDFIGSRTFEDDLQAVAGFAYLKDAEQKMTT